MARVEIAINGQPYIVACEDGQEDRLRELSATVDANVRALAGRVGQVGQARLLAMACLGAADELAELRAAARRAEAESGRAAAAEAEERAAEAEARAAAAVERAAARLEAIAARLDSV